MKNIFISVLSIPLAFSLCAPTSLAQEQESQQQPVLDVIKYGDHEIYLEKNEHERITTLNNDGLVYEAKYNNLTNKLVFNGEEVDSETLEGLKAILNSELENIDGNVSPTNITPGEGGNSGKRVESAKMGKLDLRLYDEAALAVQLMAIAPVNVAGAALASIAYHMISNWENDVLYYKWYRYSEPDKDWPLLYRNYTNELTLYSDSKYSKKINSYNFPG